MSAATPLEKPRHKPVPRGIARSGPAILSYGFRPFFLGAALFAILTMVAWIGALTLGWEIGGSYGLLDWHAHEMLFGYASAALAGFMLTAIPNWTGRLPVSGRPLLALVLLWLAGRLTMAMPDLLGLPASMAIDAAFLPLLALVAGIEVVAGRNWKNLKILVALVALTLANVGFHLSVALNGTGLDAVRPAVSVYLMLIALVGGRIIPSFTRNWLVKAGSSKLPRSFGRFDMAAMLALLLALAAWSVAPEGPATAVLCAVAAVVQAMRLWRWRGWSALEEPLLFALHVAYAFIPVGLAGVAAAALGGMAAASALHLLVVGGIGGMTLAVMTRASLGHTGHVPVASPTISAALLALLLAATLRPFAEALPEFYHPLLAGAGLAWIAAFGLFLVALGRPLLSPRS